MIDFLVAEAAAMGTFIAIAGSICLAMWNQYRAAFTRSGSLRRRPGSSRASV